MENREALTIARNFVDLMRATPTGKRVPAFGMTGPKGVGKSYIAWATVRELRDLRIPAMGYTISQMVRAIMRVRKDEHKWDELFERLITVPVLFIDDLGKEYIRKDADNFVESFMFDVIDERTNRCLPTLVTSNFDPVALEQRRYAEHEKMQSIIDRLNKGFAKGSRWLEMGGQSRRVF
jgi:DNA replication protein DnaC